VSVLFCRTRLKELVFVSSVLQDPFKELVCATRFCSAGPSDRISLCDRIMFCRTRLKELFSVTDPATLFGR